MYTLTCILICAHTHAHILPQSYPFTPSNTPSYRPTIGSHTQVTYTLLQIHNYSHTDALTHKFLYRHIIIYTCAQHGHTQQPHILVHPHWMQDCIHMCSHTCTHTPSHRYSHTRARTTVSPQKDKSPRKSPSRNISADVHPDRIQG